MTKTYSLNEKNSFVTALRWHTHWQLLHSLFFTGPWRSFRSLVSSDPVLLTHLMILGSNRNSFHLASPLLPSLSPSFFPSLQRPTTHTRPSHRQSTVGSPSRSFPLPSWTWIRNFRHVLKYGSLSLRKDHRIRITLFGSPSLNVLWKPLKLIQSKRSSLPSTYFRQ